MKAGQIVEKQDVFKKTTPEERKRRQLAETMRERTNGRIAVLQEQDFEEVLGGNWRSEKPTRLDLSAERYKLETLTGDENFKGLMSDDLFRKRLTFIDVSDNRLRDINIFQEGQFPCLTCLIARRNMISSPVLVLSRLLELNLAHNEMKILPSLSGLGMLEVLIVSHNHLEGTFDKLQSNKRLRRIDLAYNRYRLSAHQLTIGLEALSSLPSLVELRLIENPFVAYIKEYQIFVLKKLKDLKKLDGVDITANIRSELDHYDKLYSLDTYNETIEDRQGAIAKKERDQENERQGGPKIQQQPQYNAMLVYLEDICDDSSCLLENVAEINAMAGHVVDLFLLGQSFEEDGDGGDDGYGNVEHQFWEGVEERFASGGHKAQHKAEKVAVSRFLELVLSIMERHDSVRLKLVEALGRLACMKKHGFGLCCMETLSQLMLSSENGKSEVVAVLNGTIIKNLTAFTQQSMNTYHCQTLIEGLVSLMKTPDINKIVAESLTPLIESLCKYFLEKTAQEAKFCIKLLAHGTGQPENALMISQHHFVEKVVTALDNPTIAEDAQFRSLWLDTLLLAQNLAMYGNDEVFQQIKASALHARVIQKLRDIRTSGQHREKASTANNEIKTLDGIMRFLYALMQKNEALLRECCESYHIIRELTEFVKEHKCKPPILAQSTKTITMILRDPAMCKKHIAFIVKELRKLDGCLQYLGLKKYNDLFEDEVIDVLNLPAEHPVNQVLIEMLGIIEFFADVDEADEEGEKHEVNQYLDQKNREKTVLKLLEARNEDVKFAVLSCISKVPIDQFDEHEMGIIIKFLCDSNNIAAGRTEEILQKTIRQLERLASGDGQCHDTFRKKKADEALGKTYDILLQNSGRATFGHAEEEEEKLALSISCVSFLGACSRYPPLHVYMRSQRIHFTFNKILKNEEELHRPTSAGVNLEQAWCGRSIEFLMRCLAPGKEYKEALHRHKKVSFRVMTRLADVLEGKTDGLRESNEGYSLEIMCKKETRMWKTSKTENFQKQLGDPELRDRFIESKNFIRADGIALIIQYLTTSKTIEREAVYQKQFDESTDKKDEIQEHARKLKEMGEQDETSKKEDEEVKEVEMEEDEETYEQGSGLSCLMRAAQCCEDTVNEDDDAIFVTPPPNFTVDEDIFDDEKEGLMNPSYIMSAAFRAVYAVVSVPPDDDSKNVAIQTMRDPKMVKRLLTLMEGASYLSCNLAAKFLHMMILILEPGVFGSVAPKHRVEVCSLLSTFVNKICGGMVKLLRLTKDKRLGAHEQTLCVEVARLCAMMVRTVTFFKAPLFTEKHDVQDICITKALDWLIPRDALRLCIAMILYELQLDAGAGIGNRISREYVLEAYRKMDMKERATHFLAGFMVRCPDCKYDILEVFSVAEVFQRMQVRPSYLRDLLDEANMQTFLNYIDRNFIDIVGMTSYPTDLSSEKIEHDRVVQMALVKVLDAGVVTTGILCSSTHLVAMLKPNGSAPPYKNDQAGYDWDPSWELEFPRNPSVLWAKSHYDVRRVFRLFGPQMLGIHWESNDQAAIADASAPRVPFFAKRATVDCSVIIFQRSRDRDRVSRALKRHAKGDETEAHVANITFARQDQTTKSHVDALSMLNDGLLNMSVMKAVGKKEVLMATVAVHLEGNTRAEKMCVLTMGEVILFTIDMSAWRPPEDYAAYAQEEEVLFTPSDVIEPDPGGDRKLPRPHEKHAHKSAEKSSSTATEPQLLTKQKPYQLKSLKQITFDDRSEQPDLIFDFPEGELKLRFYDDTGREDWRRALAYYLCHPETGSRGDWERGDQQT